jgi:hypothetical protein
MQRLPLVSHATTPSYGWCVVLAVFLTAAHTASAMSVPRWIVVDLGPYADAETANADARNVDWFTTDPRQTFVTLAWAALELRNALRTAGVEAHILPAPPHSVAEPTFTLHVLRPKAQDNRLGDQGFRIGVAAAQILIEGNTRIGVLYGTYRVLRRLGFRWYSPSDQDSPPNLARKTLHWTSWHEKPHTPFRGFWIPMPAGSTVDEAYVLWMARNHLNLGGVAPPYLRAKLGMYAWNGGHRLLREELSVPGLFAAHPEWYGLVAGQRRPISATSSTYHNPAFANPALASYVAHRLIQRLDGGDLGDVDLVALWPSDGQRTGWDESVEARAVGNNTDTLLLFSLRVLRYLQQAVRDGRLKRPVWLSGISYNATWELPTRPQVLAELAAGNYVHVFYEPERSFGGVLTENLALRDANRRYVERLAAWKALGRYAFGVSEYFNNSHYTALPILEHRTLAANFRQQMQGGGVLYAYQHPLRTMPGPRRLTNVLLALTAWHGTRVRETQVSAWGRDYFQRRYGRLAAPVREIYDLLDTAVSNAREMALRVSLRHLLFLQHRRQPLWTAAQVSALADAYLTGGTQTIPAPSAQAPGDTDTAHFLGLRDSLRLLASAKAQVNALRTAVPALTVVERRKVDELAAWTYAAWRRYEVMRVAVVYYREVNLATDVPEERLEARARRIRLLNALLAATPLTQDTVSPFIDQRQVLYPPEWLHY